MNRKDLETAEHLVDEIQSTYSEEILMRIRSKQIHEIMLCDFDEIIRGAIDAKRIIKKIIELKKS